MVCYTVWVLLLGGEKLTRSNLKGFQKWTSKRQNWPVLRQFSLSKFICLRGEMLLAKRPLLHSKGTSCSKTPLNWTESRTGTAGTVLQEPKPEPESSLSG